jgi:hypothetical protein
MLAERGGAAEDARVVKRERAVVGRIIETRQAKRAASLAQAASAIEQHKASMHEAENAGLLRTLARLVRRATSDKTKDE